MCRKKEKNNMQNSEVELEIVRRKNTVSGMSDQDMQNMINTQVALPKASDYEGLTPEEHIRRVPDTYVGSVVPNDREKEVILFKSNAETGETDMESKMCTITLAEAIERVFLEILSNAGDNAEKSRRIADFSKKIGGIDVIMDRYTITIRNGGVPIPIEKCENGMWLPEFIFGTLRSSSNYQGNDAGTYCGRNGYGAKLTNIFSTIFSVSVGDSLKNLQFDQTWTEGMKKKSEAVVKAYNKKESYVEVKYSLDFPYFQMEQYTDEAFNLFAQHVANIGLIHKIPVSFNGIKFKCQNIKDYCKLLFGEEASKNAIVHYEWPVGTELVEKNGTMISKDKSAKAIIEMCVLDTPDNGKHLSFVNGIPTTDGGVHVNSAYKSISSTVLDMINDKMGGKKKTGGRQISLSIADVKPHVTIVINATLINPRFSSQTKTFLNKPEPKINVSDKLQKKLLKWDLILRLKASIEAKQFRKARGTDGKKKQHLKGMKAEDANDAGTSRSTSCSALITEGDSAMAYAVKWISLVPNGRNLIGAFPLRGKPLNAMNADVLRVSDNLVFQRLKKFLGLREGVDYTIDENYKKLRYGYLMILADADPDGGHIKGLLLLYIYKYFRSLLQRGCVYMVLTPIIRAYVKGETLSFYTVPQYEQWKKATPEWSNYEHNYYKGLGTSTDVDIAQDVKSPKVIACIYDDLAPQYFDLAFNNKKTNERKEWLMSTHKALNIEQYAQIPISTLIDQDLSAYAHENNERSIPNKLDGLKPGQRKIIYCALYKARGWTNAKITEGKCEKKKVAQFGALVAAETEYHHGEQCMEQTIVTMTQSFIGSNNLPYFMEEGQFGTRNMLGKDKSSARYIYLKPQRWLPYVFKKEDESLYKYIVEEGKEQEPEFMLPIIPLHLINGAQGIGTGWCTFMPNHRVENVCGWLMNRITGQKNKKLIPHYNGFEGSIELVPRDSREKKASNRADKAAAKQAAEDLRQDAIGGNFTTVEILTEAYNKSKGISKLGVDQESDGEEDSESSLNGSMNGSLDGSDDEYDPDKMDKDDEFLDKDTKMSMVVKGKYRQDGKFVTIDEIPIGRSIHSYNSWLEELADAKVIKGVKNMSKHDKPLFHIEGFTLSNSDNANIKRLKLEKSFGLSTMTMMNENKCPISYRSAEEAIEDFYQTRLGFYQLRKNNMLKAIRDDIDFKNMKIKFIYEVAVTKSIEARNRKKADVVADMARFGIHADIYDKVKLNHLSVEEIEKLNKQIQDDEEKYRILDETPSDSIWLKDIQEFLRIYARYYK